MSGISSRQCDNAATRWVDTAGHGRAAGVSNTLPSPLESRYYVGITLLFDIVNRTLLAFSAGPASEAGPPLEREANLCELPRGYRVPPIRGFIASASLALFATV